MGTQLKPAAYVLVNANTNEVLFITLAYSELEVWTVYYGWPSEEEIEQHKKAGRYVSLAGLSYHNPQGEAKLFPV